MDELGPVAGVPAPPEFDDLAPADRAELARLIQLARTQRSRQIDSSIEASLRVLPALLRGPVKRALGM